MKPPRAFAPLSHRPFALVWMGSLASNMGTWAERVSVGVYIAEQTGSAAWTGIISALMFVPALVLIPLGGVLADRFNRRKYLYYVTIAQLLVAGTVWVFAATGAMTLPVMSVLMFLTGCGSSLLAPAVTALIARLVPREQLAPAIILSSGQFNLARVLGPALAAVVIYASGVTWVFFINALSFGALLVALSAAKLPAEAPPRRGHLLSELFEAARAIRTIPPLRSSVTCAVLVGFFIAPFIGLVPVFAIETLNASAADAPLLSTSQGLGAVAAALVASTFADRFGLERWMSVASVLVAGACALLWLSPTFGVALASMCFLGAVYLSVLSVAKSASMAYAPDHMQARVSGIYGGLVDTAYAIGLAVIGMAGDWLGLRIAGVSACVLYLCALMALRPRVVATTAQQAGWTELVPKPRG